MEKMGYEEICVTMKKLHDRCDHDILLNFLSSLLIEMRKSADDMYQFDESLRIMLDWVSGIANDERVKPFREVFFDDKYLGKLDGEDWKK